MGVFSSGGVGIDLGSANVTICLENEGIVLREPSYVLTAMGLDPELARGSLRISLGSPSTRADVDQLVAALPEAVARARRVAQGDSLEALAGARTA